MRALDGVDLEVGAGEVHCLLGQNGAGKSTLIKVLAGAHQPDAGTLLWDGEEITLPSPIAALRRGVATIYQELDLVDGLSVAENVFLGHEVVARRLHPARRAERPRHARCSSGWAMREIPPVGEVGRLSAAGKQIVSMARALSHDARVIVMDEPSAVLAHDEVDNLFRVIRDLTASGVAVIYISHRLEEIREIGDRVTVLKDGRTVATGSAGPDNADARGRQPDDRRDVEFPFPPRTDALGDDAAEVLRGRRTRPARRVRGRVLRGAGRRDRRPRRAGRVRPFRDPRDRLRRPAAAHRHGDLRRASAMRPGDIPASVAAGMGMAPEERKSQALLLHESVATNITAASLRRYARLGFLDRRRERADAAAAGAGAATSGPTTRRGRS